MVVPCSNFLLQHLRRTHPERLAKSGDGVNSPIIVGDVLIHPSAQIDPTAKVDSTQMFSNILDWSKCKYWVKSKDWSWRQNSKFNYFG